MQALEFTTRLHDEKHIDIPESMQDMMKKDAEVRVLILVKEEDVDETQWHTLVHQQFLKGYTEADAIYDNE